MAAETDTERNQEKVKHVSSKLEAEQSTVETTASLEEHPAVLQVQELKEALEKAQEEVKSHQDAFLRAKAEAENTRRIAKLDVEKAHKFGIEKFAKDILLVLDSIEHGLEASSKVTEPQVESVIEGMKLTHKMLLGTLENFGIRMLDPLGEPFDPAKHEALTMQPSDEYQPNTVMNVIQKGFLLHERVLRPARVIVAKANDSDSQATNVDEKA